MRTGYIKFQDDFGKQFELRTPPKRIVSLVPSDTYSLLKLGAGERVVGRTEYCVAPKGEVESIAIVGGTKNVDVDKVMELKPDLVIANQEENTRAEIERMRELGMRVLILFPQRVAAGVAHLARLAVALGGERGEEPAHSIVANAYHQLREAEAAAAKVERPVPTFLPIWMDPLMTINKSTFISDVLTLVGAANVFGDRDRRYPLAADVGSGVPLSIDCLGGRDVRYPRVTLDEVVLRQPELVLLPDEPHAFSEADAEVFRALAIPAAKNEQVRLCDGKDLMWYGARSVEGLAKLRAIVDAARHGSSQKEN